MSTVYVHATRLTGELSFQQCLSQEEESRAAAFKFKRDKERYRECHGRLRHQLAHYTGTEPEKLTFQTGPFDKPELTDGAWHFNLSHSDDLFAVAVCQDHAVGIDIETGTNNRNLLELVSHVCHATEKARLEGLSSAQEKRRLFLSYWTAKEAFLKAIGCGFQQAPESVCIAGDPFSGQATVETTMTAATPEAWKLHFLAIADSHVLTVAARRECAIELVESPFDA